MSLIKSMKKDLFFKNFFLKSMFTLHRMIAVPITEVGTEMYLLSLFIFGWSAPDSAAKTMFRTIKQRNN